MDFSPQAHVVEPPPISRQIVVKIILSIIDILFNVAAGRYAALTGAKINSWSRSSSTAQIIYNKTEIASLGAKAGAFKAAILAFWHFGTEYADLNLPIGLIFAMISSRFGIAVLVTCLVSSLALGTVNEALVKPALVASLFLGSEMIPAITGNSLTTAFWNALSGYLFAVIARREGFEICSNKAGFSAGLVYGIFTTLKTIFIILARGPTVSHSTTSAVGTRTTVRNNLETYTVFDPSVKPRSPISTFDKYPIGIKDRYEMLSSVDGRFDSMETYEETSTTTTFLGSSYTSGSSWRSGSGSYSGLSFGN